MLRYSNSIVLLNEKDTELFIGSFKTKVQSKLKTIECRTEIQRNIIKFDRVVRYLPSSGQGKNEVLKLLREGSIEIEKMDSGEIKIEWEVKLETLLFISIWAGLLAGLGFGFVHSSLLIFIIVGIFFFLIPYYIGYFLIRNQIDNIIFTSM